ncbi:MAG TPA: hypothetical protein VH161_02610 [Candidatus Acidoferrales bacterium]|nr:hypothetical protein [Candidatus Acidoferrales bacterium]
MRSAGSRSISVLSVPIRVKRAFRSFISARRGSLQHAQLLVSLSAFLRRKFGSATAKRTPALYASIVARPPNSGSEGLLASNATGV